MFLLLLDRSRNAHFRRVCANYKSHRDRVEIAFSGARGAPHDFRTRGGGPHSAFTVDRKSPELYNAFAEKRRLYIESWGALEGSHEPGCATDEFAARLARNQIMDDLERLIELYHETYDDFVYESTSGTELAFDVLGLGLGAWGALSSGASQIASALSGAASGTRASLRDNLLHDTKQSVLLTMQSLRDEHRSKIVIRKILSVRDYRLDDGIRDLWTWYQAGSLKNASLRLYEDARLKALNTQAARNEREERVRSAMTANPLEARSIYDELRSNEVVQEER